MILEIIQLLIFALTLFVAIKPSAINTTLPNSKVRIIAIISGTILLASNAYLAHKIRFHQKEIRVRDQTFVDLKISLSKDSVLLSNGIPALELKDYGTVIKDINDYERLHTTFLDSIEKISDKYELRKFSNRKNNELDTGLFLTHKFNEHRKILNNQIVDAKSNLLKSLIHEINNEIHPLTIASYTEKLTRTEHSRWVRTVVYDNHYFAINCKIQEINNVKSTLKKYSDILSYCGVKEIRLGIPKKEIKTNVYVPVLYSDYFKTEESY